MSVMFRHYREATLNKLADMSQKYAVCLGSRSRNFRGGGGGGQET